MAPEWDFLEGGNSVRCYPTLPPEREWPEPDRGEKFRGGKKMGPEFSLDKDRREKKMAVEHEWPRTAGPTNSLSKYCEIPARGVPVDISGKQADLYKTVLESMGYSTKLDKFTIDSRGDSPELREELGKDYLDNRVIIVSESQIKKSSMLPMLDGNPSYVHRIADQVQNTASELVKRITPHEALTGKINLLYGPTSILGLFDPDFKDNTTSTGTLHAVLSLDTLTESVKKINFLNNKISFITESSLKTLDKDLLNGILTEIHPLTTKYGSIETIRNLSTVDIPLSEEILYFEHKGRDVFFFNKYTPSMFLVYNGDKKVEPKLPFGVEILHGSEKSKIMDHLVKGGFLKIEKENIFKNLESMAKSFLGKQVKDCSELTGFHFYKIFKKYKDSPGIAGKLKETDWYLLRDACYGNIEFSSLPLQLKEIITSPSDEAVKTYIDLLNNKISEP
jgi:hypothetical protein